MRTLFIADLHLSENKPEITEAFFTFLDLEASKQTDALYILGDLFEVWIGDDEHTPLMDLVARKLTCFAKKSNVPIYYIHGNRDFMLGKKYAKQASMQILDEHTLIELYGKKILIMHGDTLCLFDKNYQKMRKIIRNPALQSLFNLMPLFIRKKMGWKIRTASTGKKVYKTTKDMGVTQSEVTRLVDSLNIDILIHGHTHNASVNEVSLEHKSCKRFDVGDWGDNLSFVEVFDGRTNLVIHPINFYQAVNNTNPH